MKSAFKGLLLLSFATLLSVPAFGAYLFSVTVITSTQFSNTGYLELQFDSSSMTTQLAGVDVLNFATDGTLNPIDTNNAATGDVAGTLPAKVSMDDGQPGADYLEAITFGHTIMFNLFLSGPAIDAPNGHGAGTFTLDFLNADMSGFLFTEDSINDVPVFTIDINADGSVTPTTFLSSGGDPSVVTFSGPFSVPEPSTLTLFGLGACALLALWRRSTTVGTVALVQNGFAKGRGR